MFMPWPSRISLLFCFTDKHVDLFKISEALDLRGFTQGTLISYLPSDSHSLTFGVLFGNTCPSDPALEGPERPGTEQSTFRSALQVSFAHANIARVQSSTTGQREL